MKYAKIKKTKTFNRIKLFSYLLPTKYTKETKNNFIDFILFFFRDFRVFRGQYF